jgi:hypothetical protein
MRRSNAAMSWWIMRSWGLIQKPPIIAGCARRADFNHLFSWCRVAALRLVQQRLHQFSFSEAVLAAYGNRCAISGLPEPRLLDAAHIIADRDEWGNRW